MKRRFPFMVSAMALGIVVLFAQHPQSQDPFEKFLDGVKRNLPDDATLRFAGKCGVALRDTKPRFAERPGDKWLLVNDLSKGLEEMATDFFGTATAWKHGNKTLVELWDLEGDVGSEARAFYCFDSGKVSLAEHIGWSFPVTPEAESAGPGWGYEQRWTIGADSVYRRELSRFVNPGEQPIAKPKLEAGDGPDYGWTPKIYTLADLELPMKMSQ
jgi:hypothetical protein